MKFIILVLSICLLGIYFATFVKHGKAYMQKLYMINAIICW